MTQNKPYLVGLTGGIATGKSHISNTLRLHGVTVIDADQISHALTAPGGIGLPPIRAAFGDAVFEGELLNRQALGQLVFTQPEKLALLNSILHPLVFEEINRQITQNGELPALVVDIPLLYETGYDAFCDEVWCTYAPEPLQIERMKCRGLSEEAAKARIDNQMPGIQKANLSQHVIETTGTKEQSAQQAIALWKALEERLNRE
jgi:dephospho-CoA kinase